MDPLPQYPSHAFIPYLPAPSPTSPPSTPSSPKADSSYGLPPLTLHNTSSWTYCGPLLPLISSDLPSSLHTWISHTISGPFMPRLLPFLTFLHSFLRKAGAEHYWLTIRATKPTSEYDTERWHTDDIFFDYDGEKDRVGLNQQGRSGYWKLATTLLGPHTLFLKDELKAREVQRSTKRRECEKRREHACSSFRCLGCLDAVEAVRQTLAREFENKEVESPAFGEVAFFRLGDTEGAVHSEPPCTCDRIFINVIPGTSDELKSLMERWGLSFPRAWCFGVPVAFDDDDMKDTRTERDLEDRESEKSERSSVSSGSTMSLSLKEEYREWLRRKGFRYSQVFGQERGDVGIGEGEKYHGLLLR
ncbi:hypothetical protein K469DRAFT_718793 [Zopfia rhizophila CBS 207.26]|uniref:Uncharacterized protein n=1 Tax=Zopfia rhizophila CBS 207.26 TaxID=1314779 RepID=A0A6A6EIA2_9PEZI|nr:hypothetical protein K469DRAFT_718793 [Zopfia rhizophila CBS 207.26]